MDGFLVPYLVGLATSLTGWCAKVGVQKLFGGGFRKVEEQAKHYPEEARLTIVYNFGNYVHAVNSEVQQRVNDGSFDAVRAESLLNTPKVQRLLSSAAEFAAENDDDLAMRSLASLVAAALQSDAGTRLAQIVQMSERALKALRPANLRQLALIFAWKRYGPPSEALTLPNREEQVDLVEMDLFPVFEALADVKITLLDALLLEEAGTVEFRTSTGGFGNPRFDQTSAELYAILYSPGTPLEGRAALTWFVSGRQPSSPTSESFGAPNFALNASGYALGYITLMKATHENVKLDDLFGSD